MITSSPFGPTILTGSDAAAFERQIDEPPPAAAAASIARGVEMVRLFQRDGKVRINVKGFEG